MNLIVQIWIVAELRQVRLAILLRSQPDPRIMLALALLLIRSRMCQLQDSLLLLQA